MNIYVFGRNSSIYRKKIDKWLGNVNLVNATGSINYGLQGKKLDEFLDDPKVRKLHRLPILNLRQIGNKFECVDIAMITEACPTPRSWKYKHRDQIPADITVIAKPYYSLGGKDIFRVKESIEDEVKGKTHYLQEEIKNRRYELRVHTASWIPVENWLVQKRTHPKGEDVLTWNHHTGGKFITVKDHNGGVFARAKESAAKLLSAFGYAFGAADFIVAANDNSRNLDHYFIEWNLAPGWTIANTEEWYKETFSSLAKVNQDEFECIEHGLMLDRIHKLNRHDAPRRWMPNFDIDFYINGANRLRAEAAAIDMEQELIDPFAELNVDGDPFAERDEVPEVMEATDENIAWVERIGGMEMLEFEVLICETCPAASIVYQGLLGRFTCPVCGHFNEPQGDV